MKHSKPPPGLMSHSQGWEFEQTQGFSEFWILFCHVALGQAAWGIHILVCVE